jgi:CheY-like chemotaxis protein
LRLASFKWPFSTVSDGDIQPELLPFVIRILSKAGGSLGTFGAPSACQGERPEQYQVFSSMPRTQTSPRLKRDAHSNGRLAATVLLLSDDEALTDVVRRTVGQPWKLVQQGADRYVSHRVFTQPNVRLVILDDHAVEENERSWLLAQIRKHFAGASVLYVAGDQSDANEKRARTNGAHYYASKPLSLDRFVYVLQSFLQADQIKR